MRHPSDAVLLDYTAHTLSPAHRLVVSAHAADCAECRDMIGFIERVGEMVLDSLRPAAATPDDAPVAEDALDQCWSRLDATIATHKAPARPAPPASRPAVVVDGVRLPPSLQGVRPGPVRWLAPGLRHSTLLREGAATLHFIRAKPGVSLPAHTHSGLELTCVLQGSFHDNGEQYATPDVSETDAESHDAGNVHVVSADHDQDCVCIMATSGRLRFRGWLARLLQPVMPF